MCFTSKFCNQFYDFPCVLKQKEQDFLKRFSAVLLSVMTQISAFFLIEAESFQFGKRGEPCSSYLFRTFIRASRPETKKRLFGRSPLH
ncbi:hypothetical protein C3432_02985 [Citrobacter amalonaticus]|uniref:Uncharacterized protein n=1 Tax=Citrobacter amalonaticus TaxID=35703 RepID=A0A2S4S361_CITAM|nr:hypothetical protein C3432_02985 [Citrobacter amalonaticus]POT77827.1 hypothetical protein C3436_10655 [Citrobacter amalonaticus]POU68279.1 hypothetical protein C3430_04190 [Citrobacter amalonaticus]POV07882.1 hypothetical protein C3424_04200 [Citrobacter amalonaticus]